MATHMRDSRKYAKNAPLGNYHICFVRVTRPCGQYHAIRPALSHPETVSRCGTALFPLSHPDNLAYNFGFGGGNSRATAVSVNPAALCDPSQNGLFAECPHRHRPIAVRPAKPNAFPWGSTISKSPSTRIGPLLPIVILVVGISILMVDWNLSVEPA